MPARPAGGVAVGQLPPSGDVEQGQGHETVPAGLLWSDFGGAREAGDADAKETASREFAEESFGMFHDVRMESDSVSRSKVRPHPPRTVAGRVAAGVSTFRFWSLWLPSPHLLRYPCSEFECSSWILWAYLS